MSRTLALVAVCFVIACGNTSSEPLDASLDATQDSPAKDGSSGDASTSDGNAADAGQDATNNDAGCGTSCRLFSDYCNTQPCTCLSLASTQPDPTCDAGTVSCTIDPCAGKTAVCTISGCVVQ